MNGRPVGGDHAIAVWLLAALVAIGGYALAVRPTYERIADLATSAQTAGADADLDERALANRDRVEAQAARIRDDLRATIFASSASASTAAFLQNVQTLARADGVRLVGVRPDASGANAPAVAPSAAPGRTVDATTVSPRVDGFDLAAHGTFRSVVRFTADVSHLPTLVRVTRLRIDRANVADADLRGARPVDAVLGIQTLRFDRTSLH